MAKQIFDKHSHLDPYRAQSQIEATIGAGKIFTNPYIFWNSAAGEKQIEQASGKSIFTKWSVLSDTLAMAQMEAKL